MRKKSKLRDRNNYDNYEILSHNYDVSQNWQKRPNFVIRSHNYDTQSWNYDRKKSKIWDTNIKS